MGQNGYLIKMSWKSILKEDTGLGDTVSRATKKLGIKECKPCAARKKKLNKLVSYK
tara:strand:- start:913 stop:1080 length:168 start_codon:yes stop_codon:yes gene_type:complete